MDLLVRIEQDLKQALKSGDSLRLSVLRLLKSAIHYQQIDLGRELTEEEIVKVIDKETKKRRESVEAYRGKREDLADKEQQEFEILESYLQAAVSEEEIKQVIEEVLASGEENQGKVIGMVLRRLTGKRVDGNRVRELVVNYDWYSHPLRFSLPVKS